MNVFNRIILAVILYYIIGFPASSMAQFYTIEPMPSLSPATGDEVKAMVYHDSVSASKSVKTDSAEFFASHGGCEVSIERDIPIFVSPTDSLLLGLIRQRMSVCLPLDLIRVSSFHGNRQDPFSRCRSFHDGVDLACDRARVYSMLPGVIRETGSSRRGYGNYVVIDHGEMECLYGHLSSVAVSKGQLVSAGTVVGISGSTGRSTAPHLHIRLRKVSKGKLVSVDPLGFIDYLNRYVTRLQDRMAWLRFGRRPMEQLSIGSLLRAVEQYGLSHSRIVIAQSLLETGYFSSRVCLEMNNLFGLRRPDGSYYAFASWEESVRAYRDYVQHRLRRGEDYYRFLQRIGYAEDPDYVRKVRRIAESL